MRLKIHSRIRVLLTVTLTAMVVLACGSPAPPTAASSVSTEIPAEAENTAPPSAPASTATASPEPRQAYLGEIVEQGGYFMQVVSVQDPVVTDRFVKPGHRPVEVEIIVGNISGATTYPSDGLLTDTEGGTYLSTNPWINPLLSGYAIEAGQRQRGWIGFELREGAQIESLRFGIGGSQLYSGLIAQPGAVLAPLPARTVPGYPRLGEVVALDGYTLTVSRVLDPAEALPGFTSAPNNIFVAKAGMRLVAVAAVIENVSGRQLYMYPGACLLIDTQGFIYVSPTGAVANEMPSLNLDPGDRTGGLIAFPIPPNAAVEAIKCEIGSQGVITILVSGLTN